MFNQLLWRQGNRSTLKHFLGMVENADYGLRTRTADCGLGLRTRTADSDCGLGLRTTDGGLQIAEKSKYGLHNFILTKSQYKFLFYVKICIPNTIWSINT